MAMSGPLPASISPVISRRTLLLGSPIASGEPEPKLKVTALNAMKTRKSSFLGAWVQGRLDMLDPLYYTSLMNKMLIRTISIKLDVDGHEAALQETQERFNAAASWIASVCWDENITNTNTAHHRVYGETRSRFEIGDQLEVSRGVKAGEGRKVIKV